MAASEPPSPTAQPNTHLRPGVDFVQEAAIAAEALVADTGLAVDGGRCGGVLELKVAVDANHVARDGPSGDPEGHLLEYLAMLNDPPQVDRGIVAWWGWAG